MENEKTLRNIKRKRDDGEQPKERKDNNQREEAPRYDGGQARVVRKHDNLLTLQSGQQYFYVKETEITEKVQQAPKKMSRELRNLQVDRVDFKNVPGSYENKIQEGELEVGDMVNWSRPQLSPCPNKFVVENKKKKRQKKEEQPAISLVNLTTGTPLCGSKPSGKEEEETNPTDVKEDKAEGEMQEDTPKKTTEVKICTWNVNHLGDNSDRKKEKLKAIAYLLRSQKPDVLVMHEINLLTEIEDGTVWEIEDEDEGWSMEYTWHFGPMLKAGESVYRARIGSQYEFYALLHSERISLTDEYAIQVHASCDEDVREYTTDEIGTNKVEVETVRWVEHRPLMVRELTLTDTGAKFAIGIVHTSPSFIVQKSAYEYVRAMDSRYARPEVNIPWMLAGDWYVETDHKVAASDIRQEWSEVLDEWEAQLWNTTEDTNFPGKGHGMPADYFVTDGNWTTSSDAKVVTHCEMEKGKVTRIRDGNAAIKTETETFWANTTQFASLEECGELSALKHGTLKVNDEVFFYTDETTGHAENITKGKFIGKSWTREGLSDHAPVVATFDLTYE